MLIYVILLQCDCFKVQGHLVPRLCGDTFAAVMISFDLPESWPFSAKLNGLSHFGRGHHQEHFCEIIWISGSGMMWLKIISYLELWWPFCLAQLNYLCNFNRGHCEEHFCEIIYIYIEFGPMV